MWVVLFALLLARSIFSSWLSDIALFIVAPPRSMELDWAELDGSGIGANWEGAGRVDSLISLSTCWPVHVYANMRVCMLVGVSGSIPRYSMSDIDLCLFA